MELLISSYRGIGPLKFDMEKKDARGVLGDDFITESMIAEPGKTRDLYTSKGLHIQYNKSEKIEFIDILRNAEPVFLNKRLFYESFEDILTFFKSIDQEIEIDDDGILSIKYGIGIYSPQSGNDKRIIETIYIFKQDYYSNDSSFKLNDYLMENKPRTVQDLKNMAGIEWH